ncbi:hypothetical protein CCP4SC76_3670004 [Gammaproteobacteria bacterium]
MIADGSQKRLFCAIGSAARGCRGTIAHSKGYHLNQVVPLSHFKALRSQVTNCIALIGQHIYLLPPLSVACCKLTGLIADMTVGLFPRESSHNAHELFCHP